VNAASGSAEMDIQQAVDHLNVSQPCLIWQLQSGEIPCRMAGAGCKVGSVPAGVPGPRLFASSGQPTRPPDPAKN
jgi:hypothetical protein